MDIAPTYEATLEAEAAAIARDFVREVHDAKTSGRPIPVMDTVTIKWCCTCGAQAVGTFTPPIYEAIAAIWEAQHTGEDSKGFEHHLTDAVTAREARQRGNRPPFSVQLTFDSLTRL